MVDTRSRSSHPGYSKVIQPYFMHGVEGIAQAERAGEQSLMVFER